MHKNKEAGFTLMELMMTVVVLAVLTGIAIPSFMTLMPGMRLNGAARQVMGDLMAARMKAVKENNEYKVFFTGSDQYTILDDDDNDGYAESGEATTIKNIQDEYYDVTIDKTGYNDPVFQPRGTASIIILTLTNSQGAQKKVKVHLTGRVKIEDV